MAQPAEEYLVRPKVGKAFPSQNAWLTTTIHDIAKLLNNRPEQAKALELLGFSIFNEGMEFKLAFYEEEQCYADPQGDRTAVSALPEQREITMEGVLTQALSLPLTIEVDLEPYFEMGVNFFGRVRFTDADGEDHTVPLVGVGTVALDGQPHDAKATFSVGAHYATFQQRVALCFAVACAIGTAERYLDVFEARFRDLDAACYGRRDTLDHTLLCCRQRSAESFLRFMTNRHAGSGDEQPPMLTSMIKSGRPAPEYYHALRRDFTEAELGIERKWWIARQGPAKATPVSSSSALPLLQRDCCSSPGLWLGVGLGVGGLACVLIAFYWHSRRR